MLDYIIAEALLEILIISLTMIEFPNFATNHDLIKYLVHYSSKHLIYFLVNVQ